MITTEIEIATSKLNNEEIIALPTETVYGLAGNAYSEEAIKKIFALKKRPLHNPLIVHLKSYNELSKVAAYIPPNAMILAAKFWPGPITLVLKKQAKIPDILSAGKQTVAVRVPNHPFALALLQNIDFPLAAPSANPFGSISPTSAKHVEQYFPSLTILDGGESTLGIESTIIGFEGDDAILFRHGSISIEEIEKEIGKIKVQTKNDKNPTAPGMFSKHYAPKTKTYLTENIYQEIEKHKNKKIGLLLFQTPLLHQDIQLHQEILSPNRNIYIAAKNFYSALHKLDNKNLDIIIAEKMPQKGIGKAINDKLERAVSELN